MSIEVKAGLVSIIVASYNHAEYLEQRMDSLINQTYQNIEILVIDDNSPDNSVEILRKYESHSKVKLIVSQQNAGWVAVSNQGISLSSGEFVIFANCDDACDLNMIQLLVDAMNSNPSAGIAFCRSLLINKDGLVLGNDLEIQEPLFRSKCTSDTLISSAEMGRFLLYACVIPNLSAALIRRECFTKVGTLSFAYKACSDWDLFFRVAHSYDIAYVALALNSFRQHATTIRSVMKERATYEEYFRILLAQLNFLDLTLAERSRYRMRVMSLWTVHIISPSMSGIYNLPYHLRRVVSLDPFALIFLIPSLLRRIFDVVGKVLLRA